MANNYTSFSFVVKLNNQNEAQWWESFFDCAERLAGDGDDSAGLATKLGLLLQSHLGSSDYGLGVDMSLEESDEHTSHAALGEKLIWVRSEGGSGNIDVAAEIIQWFLLDSQRDDVVVFSWCNYCDRARVGEFGGGTMRVTATSIKAVTTENLERLAADGAGLFS